MTTANTKEGVVSDLAQEFPTADLQPLLALLTKALVERGGGYVLEFPGLFDVYDHPHARATGGISPAERSELSKFVQACTVAVRDEVFLGALGRRLVADTPTTPEFDLLQSTRSQLLILRAVVERALDGDQFMLDEDNLPVGAKHL